MLARPQYQIDQRCLFCGHFILLQLKVLSGKVKVDNFQESGYIIDNGSGAIVRNPVDPWDSPQIARRGFFYNIASPT